MLTPRFSVAGMGDIERGLRLKEYRARAGFGQEEVARRLNVSGKTVFNWERGADPQPENKRALAELYGRSIEEIDGLAEAPEPFQLADFIESKMDEFRSVPPAVIELQDDLTRIAQQVETLAETQRAILARLDVLFELQELGAAASDRSAAQAWNASATEAPSTGRPPANAR